MLMTLDNDYEFCLAASDSQQLEIAAKHYPERGFILLSGLESIVTAKFRPVLAARVGVNQLPISNCQFGNQDQAR